jgi:CheY-like chemotaxis protein
MDVSRRWAPRILVVDDHHDTADTLALLLKLWGYHPLVAYDGAAALEAATTQAPDALLVDLGLPGLDGCEVARRTRQHPGLERVPLLAVTGYARDEDRRRCRDAGFDHFLVKPVEPEELHALLDELL